MLSITEKSITTNKSHFQFLQNGAADAKNKIMVSVENFEIFHTDASDNIDNLKDRLQSIKDYGGRLMARKDELEKEVIQLRSCT